MTPSKTGLKKAKNVFFLYLAKSSRNEALSGPVFFCVHINFCHKNIKTGPACIYQKAQGHTVVVFSILIQKGQPALIGRLNSDLLNSETLPQLDHFQV